ncbi:ferric reductase-like transmembrane domain-containing protein [Roseobacter sp. HKCCA0434]|uniref:ferredoxin reductase family protein n=1 Tax=Roseobacter sp. HKCCA0434 TaxID=3079297 RepID=UPI002905A9A8|nr:ferric reductase-like transmembrane domain-containing protein [Roseobacter sp. HKCCA0434]
MTDAVIAERRLKLFSVLCVLIVLSPIPLILPHFQPGWTEQLISQSLGTVSLMCMSLSMLLSSRARPLEWLSGGLDKAYVLHKWLGLTALATVYLHDSFEAEIKRIPDQFGRTDLASDIGGLALDGLTVLIIATLVMLIPYRIWFWTHRLMTAVFILSAVHFIGIAKPFALQSFAGLYIMAWTVAGTLAGTYALRPSSWRRSRHYSVEEVSRTGRYARITLVPEGRRIGKPRPGQFAFLRRADGSGRGHPFTISHHDAQTGRLGFAMRQSGEWTTCLIAELETGTKLHIEGPFGSFRPARGGPRQIWIAGGIGVTPLLAWAASGRPVDTRVDIIVVDRASDAIPSLDGLRAFADQEPNVSLKVIETSRVARPTARDLLRLMSERSGRADIYFCGPKGLLNSVKEAIADAKPGTFRLLRERFEFRTGLPHPADWRDRLGLSSTLFDNAYERLR